MRVIQALGPHALRQQVPHHRGLGLASVHQRGLALQQRRDHLWHHVPIGAPRDHDARFHRKLGCRRADGLGIPAEQRAELFTRGTRLDTTGKPGTGLGLAIVRDVAEIYGGKVALAESEDLGGLMVTLSLPVA